MFNINGWELVVLAILFIALFGPERIPRIVVDGLKLMRQLREAAETATADITRELEAAARDLDEVKRSVTDLGAGVKKDVGGAMDRVSAEVERATSPAAGQTRPSAAPATENRIAPPGAGTDAPAEAASKDAPADADADGTPTAEAGTRAPADGGESAIDAEPEGAAEDAP